MKLPTVVYTSEKMGRMLESCRGSFHEFKIKKLEFIDLIGIRHNTTTLDELFRKLSSMDPLKRNPVIVEFELKPSGRKKQNIRLVLGGTSDTSQIEVAGGTKKIQLEISDPILRIWQDNTEWWDSNMITRVAPLMFGLGAILFGWIFPTLVQSPPIIQGSVLAMSTMALIYGFKRPHSFLLCGWTDHFKLLPGIRAVAVFSLALAFGGSTFLIQRTELFQVRLNQYVANSPKISSERLNRVLHVNAKNQIAVLRREVDLYSKATSSDLKRAAAQKIADEAVNLLGPSGPFANESLLLLPVVYSSARKTNPTNRLSEPVLLRMNADNQNAKLTYVAKAAEASSESMKVTTLRNWLKEIVIKDRAGRNWTRIDILNAMRSDGLNAHKEMLNELRQNSDVDFEFKPFDKDLIPNPQNSVLDETVFAIGSEIVKSIELMNTYSNTRPLTD